MRSEFLWLKLKASYTLSFTEGPGGSSGGLVRSSTTLHTQGRFLAGLPSPLRHPSAPRGDVRYFLPGAGKPSPSDLCDPDAESYATEPRRREKGSMIVFLCQLQQFYGRGNRGGRTEVIIRGHRFLFGSEWQRRVLTHSQKTPHLRTH